jgi:uncharacterized protein
VNEKFVADVHLGKLARYLRLVGFDTIYNNSYTNKDLERIAIVENRILLSRNIAFAKNLRVKSFITKSENAFTQLKQAAEHFNLKNRVHPFSRCLLCNGRLEEVSKEKILDRLEQNTINYYEEFWRCQDCDHIYWKGSHYNRMFNLIEELISKAH